jgi:hypothetical protein
MNLNPSTFINITVMLPELVMNDPGSVYADSIVFQNDSKSQGYRNWSIKGWVIIRII